MWRSSVGRRHGQPSHVLSEEVEELRPVAQIPGHESEGVEVRADAEAVGDGAAGRDRPERREAGGIVAKVVEEVRPEAEIPRDELEGVEGRADAEAFGDGTAGRDR